MTLITNAADRAIQRAAQIAAEIQISRARLRGDMEVIFELGGLEGLDAAINHERQRIAEIHRHRLAAKGYIA